LTLNGANICRLLGTKYAHTNSTSFSVGKNLSRRRGRAGGAASLPRKKRKGKSEQQSREKKRKIEKSNQIKANQNIYFRKSNNEHVLML
jgi:hypothetical protein